MLALHEITIDYANRIFNNHYHLPNIAYFNILAMVVIAAITNTIKKVIIIIELL